MVSTRPAPAQGQSCDGVPVLMYHSIAGGGAARRFKPFVVDPGEFAAQMDVLDSAGYSPLTAADLAGRIAHGRPLPQRPVVLTFDDAYADFAAAALPVLRAHGFAATLYVPTGYVGSTARWMGSLGEGDRPILSWAALRDIAAEGVEIASHSHSHVQMDRVPIAVLRDEVRRSARLLEDTLGLRVDGFAYPFGYWSRAARATVIAEGLRYACAVAGFTSTPGDDLFALPRLTVDPGLGVSGLDHLLRSHRMTAFHRSSAAAKRIAWRALRRVPAIGGDPQEGKPR